MNERNNFETFLSSPRRPPLTPARGACRHAVAHRIVVVVITVVAVLGEKKKKKKKKMMKNNEDVNDKVLTV